jgi:hypothetical protein
MNAEFLSSGSLDNARVEVGLTRFCHGKQALITFRTTASWKSGCTAMANFAGSEAAYPSACISFEDNASVFWSTWARSITELMRRKLASNATVPVVSYQLTPRVVFVHVIPFHRYREVLLWTTCHPDSFGPRTFGHSTHGNWWTWRGKLVQHRIRRIMIQCNPCSGLSADLVQRRGTSQCAQCSNAAVRMLLSNFELREW